MKCSASKFASLSATQFVSRVLNQSIQFTCLKVRFNLSIPKFVVQLQKPISESAEILFGQLTNASFKLFNFAHFDTSIKQISRSSARSKLPERQQPIKPAAPKAFAINWLNRLILVNIRATFLMEQTTYGGILSYPFDVG